LRALRIAFVCGFAWEPKGTVRARAFPLAAEVVSRGHEVTIFTAPYDNPSESRKEDVLEGVRILNIAVDPVPNLLQVPLLVKRLCRVVQSYCPDVVHVFKPKGYAGAACAWLLMKNFGGLVLDCDDWEGWGGWNDVKDYPWIVKEYIDRQEKWLIRRVPAVTTASRILERRVVELRGSSRNVFYVPNCGASRNNVTARESAHSCTGQVARGFFGLPDGPVIFYGGQFDPADDVMFFCRAAERAARRSGATIVLVGEGPKVVEVKEFFVQREGIVVRFFPRLPYEQFLQLIAASDVAAFPYPDTPIYRAKCSARIVDYMSMAKAVVTTAVGQNTEYIVDGESGVLVPPGDESRFAHELERLLKDPGLRLRLGQNAKERIKDKFSWGGVPVDNCLAAYRQLSNADGDSRGSHALGC
jgi:glycosyltransferase involved in cell wall biosynthesis